MTGTGSAFHLRPAAECRWDLVALGEVMLRLDPGDDRISSARTFRAWEGGGEYNVARALRRVFGLRTAIVTALVDNPIGRLVEDLMLQGGTDLSHVLWRSSDGVGRSVRNGLNFTERGFGVRGAMGCSDRGNSAASQLGAGDVDWEAIFGLEGARWFHTGGIFAALSESTPDVVREAMESARRHGVIVSYDLNYRPSLWKSIGGEIRARQVNRALMEHADVLVGNEEDYFAALGVATVEAGSWLARIETQAYTAMLAEVADIFPHLRVVAVSLRTVHTATRNDWHALCRVDGMTYAATPRFDMEVFDRIGGGDSFASGLIYGFLAGEGPQRAVEYGAAHGALAMTTPGDTSRATRAEVEALVEGGTARVVR